MATQLPLPPAGKVRKIFHLSDLHIRTGDKSQCRFDEYTTVFKNTLTRIECQLTTDSVIILTGDIFHNKSKVEASGIVLFYGFMSALAKLAPVYIIQGNHDYRQDQTDTPDLISALLYDQTIPNVCYLDNTGQYLAGDVGFGLVSVRDTLIPGDTSGQVDELPDFPDPTTFPSMINHKVALFHGTINNCTLQNYMKSPTGYPIKWFAGYDIACLGDVHLQQVHGEWKQGNLKWGYPGSLVQQDFGEPIIDHGFLIWDLEEKSVYAENVLNNTGFMKIKENNGHWRAQFRDTWISLNEMLAKPLCPKILSVRIIYSDTKICQETVNEIFTAHGKNAQITTYIANKMRDTSSHDATMTDADFDVSMFNSPLTWTQYIEENTNKDIVKDVNWKQWLSHPESLCISTDNIQTETLKKSINDRNAKLLKQIEIFQQATDISNTTKSTVSLKYMSWSWMLCFCEDCWFNFETLKGDIASINARNGYGKSSFLEVVCLALYGETIPSRYCKENSISVVCQQRPTKANGKTFIQFMKNDVLYTLKRSYCAQSKLPKKLLINEVQLAQIKEDGTFEIIHSGKTAVDAWIAKHLGSLESFLLSCMLTQNSDQDFFHLKSNEQLQLLDKALNFHSINELSEIFKQASLAYKAVFDNINTLQDILAKDLTNKDIDETTLEISRNRHEEVQKELLQTETAMHNIPETWNGISDVDLMKNDEEIQSTIQDFQKAISSTIGTHALNELHQQKGVLLNQLAKYTKPSNVKTFTKEEALAIEQKLNTLHQKRDTIMSKQPVKPSVSMSEFTKWNAKYIKWMSFIDTTYGSMDEMLLKSEKLASSVFKPTIAKKALEVYRKNMEADKAKLIHKHWFDQNDADFEENVNDVQATWMGINSKKDKVDTNITTCSEQLDALRVRWKDAQKQFSDHNRLPIQRPSRTEEECNTWFERFAEIKGQVPFHTEKLEHMKEWRKTKEAIDDIACAQHPYNDACWACKKQPWKLQLNEKTNAIDSLQYQLQKYQVNNFDPQHIEEEIAHSENILAENTQMERSLQEWTQWKNKWQSYRPFELKWDQLQTLVQETHKLWEEKELELGVLTRERENIMKIYKVSEKEYDNVTFCKENRMRWKETTNLLEEQDSLWKGYQEALEILEHSETTRTFQEQHAEWTKTKDDYERFKKWQEEFISIENQVEIADTQRNNAYWYVYSKQLSTLNEQLEIISLNETIKDQLVYWQKVVDSKQGFEAKNNLKERFIQLRKKETDASQVFHRDQAKYDTYEKISAECQVYRNILETMDTAKDVIEHVQSTFAGFRKWLYQTKIIPRLLYETNKIVSYVTHSDTLKLDVDIRQESDKDAQKLAFSWFIKDGLNRPPIEKASGFQRFIIGLGVRISLSYIGASTVTCQQLFIDEGFVACDKTHLARIPEFMQNILSIYDTIILVSHLDEIKDTTSIQIPICRANGLSTIQYGEKIEVEHKKKRGRKPKEIITL